MSNNRTISNFRTEILELVEAQVFVSFPKIMRELIKHEDNLVELENFMYAFIGLLEDKDIEPLITNIFLNRNFEIEVRVFFKMGVKVG